MVVEFGFKSGNKIRKQLNEGDYIRLSGALMVVPLISSPRIFGSAGLVIVLMDVEYALVINEPTL
jgi:hypothetical protein